MNNKSFYTILIESEEAEKESFVQVFWTWADHIGEAIHRIVNVASNEGVKNPFAREIDPYEFESLPDEVYEIETTGVLTSGVKHYYPSTPCLKVPQGVIESAIEGNYDAEDLHQGYTAYVSNDDFYCLDVVLPEKDLREVFIQLTGTLPEITVSWVEITEEWENIGKTQLFTNEDIHSANKISNFLKSNDLNILQNGFLKFTVYCREGSTNLLISDHKEICLMSRSQEIQLRIIQKLKDLKITESDNLKSLKKGYHHWHYRPDGSFNRNELISHLKNNGFSLWKEIEANN